MLHTVPLLCASLFWCFGTRVLGSDSGRRVVSGSLHSRTRGEDLRCGKTYRSTDLSFHPSGALLPPTPSPPLNQLKLDLRVYPRKSFYLPSDKNASFIIDTPVSYFSGTPYVNSTFDPERSPPNQRVPLQELKLFVRSEPNGITLVNWVRVPVNASGVEVWFSLEGIEANSKRGWAVSVVANSPDAIQSYYSTAQVMLLPERNDIGSSVRIDRLYGGIEVKSRLTEDKWKPMFPYGVTADWKWIRSFVEDVGRLRMNLEALRLQGYNIVQIIPPSSVDASDSVTLTNFLRACDEVEMYVMYNLREIYHNHSSITKHVSQLKSHPSLLVYQTANAPDYYSEPPSSSFSAYDMIRSIDRYHPVSLLLHCDNYFFGQYATGADVVLEDTSPLNGNTSWSAQYKTPCNSTYGDCGCDNCHSNDPTYPEYVRNQFLDLVDRVERLSLYQQWLGVRRKLAPGDDRKPIWSIPQALPGEVSPLDRLKTAQKESIMGLLRINHGATGLIAQDSPVDPVVIKPVPLLAKFISAPPTTQFLMRARRIPLQTYGDDGLLDAVMWVAKESVLVSLVFLGMKEAAGPMGVKLPRGLILNGTKVWWGSEALSGKWSMIEEGTALEAKELSALEVTILQGSRG